MFIPKDCSACVALRAIDPENDGKEAGEHVPDALWTGAGCPAVGGRHAPQYRRIRGPGRTL